MTKVNKRLGEKIRELRKKKNITQEEFAFQANLDYSYMNQIENGKRNPSVEAINGIAKALGVSIKDLFS